MAQIVEDPAPAYDKSSGLGYSRKEAQAAGRALREKTTRISHSGWQPSATRKDPINILIDSSEGRQPNLIPIRYGRMLQSPFTFFRGAAAIMAADLATTPNTGIYVQSCGDCHMLNFGCFGTPERKIIFDLSDFDETLPAPWEWDVKRLAVSFVIASLQNNLGAAAAKDISRTCAHAYRMHTAQYSKMSPLRIWYSHISADDIMHLMNDEQTSKRFARRIEKEKLKGITNNTFPQITEIKYGRYYIKDNPPLIFHHVDANEKEYYELVEQVFQGYLKSLGEEKRILLEQYKFQDIAMKAAGIGSVGTLCGISLRMSANNEPLFLQIKEARDSVLEPYAGKSVFDNNAKRVVIGQKMMQTATDVFLGWTSEVNDRSFYIRQLHDIKIKPAVEVYDERMMKNYAELCGWALARAHARSGKTAIVYGYLGNSGKFDDAVAQFAIEYAEQNERDFAALKTALKEGKLEAYIER